MCASTPCGCTVITESTRMEVLAQLLIGWNAGRNSMVDWCVPDGVYISEKRTDLLHRLMGRPGMKQLLHLVAEAAEEYELVPSRLALALHSRGWNSSDDGGTEYSIIFEEKPDDD